MGYSIAFVANAEKPNALAVRDEAVCIAQRRGFACFTVDPASGRADARLKEASFLAAFGGDGTILKAAPIAAEYGLPILGVNLGRVGFLSEIMPDGFDSALSMFLEGKLTLESRMMLACSVNGAHVCDCLNDVLLYKQNFSGVAHIGMRVNGEDAGNVFCDGMIVSTPTGSTAYSISVGGPIIAPGLDACILVPVCPHSLLVRPIVAEAGAQIDLTMKSDGALYADGVKMMDVNESDTVHVTKSARTTRFLRVGAHNLYSLIKEKLS